MSEDQSWIRVPVPNEAMFAEMGEAAESALMSELGCADAGEAAWNVIRQVAEVIDWSGAARGKFSCDSGRDRHGEDPQGLTTADGWLPVPGYEGLYAVNDHGLVLSLARKVRKGNGSALVGATIMSEATDRGGYRRVSLSKAGKKTQFGVHQIVCAAFHGARPEGHEVAHLNGDPGDNRAINLGWRLPAENNAHKRSHGTHQAGAKHPRSKLTDAQVAQIRASTKSTRKIADEFGVGQSQVSRIRTGARWAEGIAERRNEDCASPNLSSSNPSPQEIEEVALLPCPLCGDVMFVDYGTLRHVEQGSCLIGGYAWGGPRAVTAWNTRPSHTEEIERLRGALERANANHEHFERQWYLRGDEIEALQSHNAKMREALTAYCTRYLVDEHETPELCGIGEEQHKLICDLFDALSEGGGGRG